MHHFIHAAPIRCVTSSLITPFPWIRDPKYLIFLSWRQFVNQVSISRLPHASHHLNIYPRWVYLLTKLNVLNKYEKEENQQSKETVLSNEFLCTELCDQSCSLNQSTVKDIILTWTFVTCKLKSQSMLNRSDWKDSTLLIQLALWEFYTQESCDFLKEIISSQEGKKKLITTINVDQWSS